ncbi:hypothetical protein [Pedobacter alpinus]|uniref:DUF4398 domain-containing protein n=1 Tax=Pedobacter alpinus TaxID=1590643 RepID=A0ABW5TRJ8_9SPHI
MKIRIGKYHFGLLALLLFSACAKKGHFEWVKVNPDKIQLAKERQPQTDFVRQVNLVLELKEKEKTTYYTESSGFFAAQSENLNPENYKSSLQKNIAKSNTKHKKVIKVDKAHISSNPLENNKVTTIKSHSSLALSSADKLNNALKIPLNSKALKSKKNAASFGQTSSEIREMAFKDIKKKNPEIEKQAEAKEKRGKNLMWAGLVLIVLGGIMGFVFGRSAFLIALAGVVFAGIGYFFKI